MEEQTSKEALLRKVEDLHGQARRARRLAQTLTVGADQATLLAAAKELDEEADRLEKQAADAKTGVLKR
jgi:hypothetical protein